MEKSFQCHSERFPKYSLVIGALTKTKHCLQNICLIYLPKTCDYKYILPMLIGFTKN